jgi:Ca-activated chloride channel family protein
MTQPGRSGRRERARIESSGGQVRAGVLFVATLAAIAAAVAPPGVSRVAAQQAAPPQRPSFRAGVDVVSLQVSVTNSDGRYVTDLQSENFSVFEDGVKQDITFFDRSNLPLVLSLLLDTSASMEERIRTAQEAAIGFAKRLRPQDLGELIDFNTRVEVTQGFTNNVDQLEAAIRKTAAGGSTALYNAIYISLNELKKIQARSADEVRRQAIVVFSDGEDTSSLVTFEQVLDLAKRSETAIFAIGLRPGDEVLGKGFKEADFVMRELAQQTGGRWFFPSRIDDLAGIYSQIADELSSQYMVGYISKNARRDGAWRRVIVRVDRPGDTPRTKQGYFAPAPR